MWSSLSLIPFPNPCVLSVACSQAALRASHTVPLQVSPSSQLVCWVSGGVQLHAQLGQEPRVGCFQALCLAWLSSSVLSLCPPDHMIQGLDIDYFNQVIYVCSVSFPLSQLIIMPVVFLFNHRHILQSILGPWLSPSTPLIWCLFVSTLIFDL